MVNRTAYRYVVYSYLSVNTCSTQPNASMRVEESYAVGMYLSSPMTVYQL